MKRFQEKIKDLVDVRVYETVKNFASDTAATVAAYRFTDATADLMAKWLDEVSELGHRTTGVTRALAGNRGVGKSHFLAAFSALAGLPELRSRITDAHVSLSAQRLPRQRLRVVNVERGLGATLVEELRAAIVNTFSNVEIDWGNTPQHLIAQAVELTGEMPLIITIDSAYDRQTRIKRDDGGLLGELAEAARNARIFLAIALDDDIAGADGVNAAIARTYSIDYLDQEHLYRIVDAFLIPKRPAARKVLRDLYQSFRESTAGFNWSETRFASLYPIHPVVVDVSPSIRLFAAQFAFLPFAAETATKVLNRPAHSLLALDEVFDRVEADLRQAEELSETFAVYDELVTTAIGQIPVMQRLQAKLILKGLLILSLDGRGATARELGASLLIYDENQPEQAVKRIEEIAELFVSTAPAGKVRQSLYNNEVRYSLSNTVGASFEARLAEAAKLVNANEIGRVLRRIGQARFSDWVFNDFGSQPGEASADLQIHWRGSIRRGRIIWRWDEAAAENAQTISDHLDWQIFVIDPDENLADKLTSEIPIIVWQPAPLKHDEEEAVRRYAALFSNSELADEFGETAIAAGQTTAAVVERIWTRIFLENGRLILNDRAQAFELKAHSARSLKETLEVALEPVFAERFPAHPQFAQLLTSTEVSALVSDLFGGADANSTHAQHLAAAFAAPLNLVTERNAHFVLETDENLLKLPLVEQILELTEAASGKGVYLREIHQKLKAAPHGLQREAQYLLLAALVARRRIEFVTANEDRISHRSLDLKIVWADVIGVAQSSVQPRSGTELLKWAVLLTEDNDLVSLEDSVEREKIQASLSKWFAEWREANVLKRFDEIPDDALNVHAWRIATHTNRTFGTAATAIEEFLQNEISLEEALERVIDAFGDAPESVTQSRSELAELKCFVEAAHLRQIVWRYVAFTEATEDKTIESLRLDLLDELMLPENAFKARECRMFESTWHEFRHQFTEYYVRRHDDAMHSTARLQNLESQEGTPEYADFVGLSQISLFPTQYLETAQKLQAEIKAAQCHYDVRQILQNQPFCACGFRIAETETLKRMPHELNKIIAQGRQAFRRMLMVLAAPLATALGEIAQSESSEDFVTRARALAETLRRGDELPLLSKADLRILTQAVTRMPAPTVRVRSPRGFGAIGREDMRARVNQWFDNLPNAPVFVKMQEDE